MYYRYTQCSASASVLHTVYYTERSARQGRRRNLRSYQGSPYGGQHSQYELDNMVFVFVFVLNETPPATSICASFGGSHISVYSHNSYPCSIFVRPTRCILMVLWVFKVILDANYIMQYVRGLNIFVELFAFLFALIGIVLFHVSL